MNQRFLVDSSSIPRRFLILSLDFFELPWVKNCTSLPLASVAFNSVSKSPSHSATNVRGEVWNVYDGQYRSLPANVLLMSEFSMQSNYAKILRVPSLSIAFYHGNIILTLTATSATSDKSNSPSASTRWIKMGASRDSGTLLWVAWTHLNILKCLCFTFWSTAYGTLTEARTIFLRSSISWDLKKQRAEAHW